MATDSPSAGETLRVFWENEWHELVIRSRKSAAMDSEILSFLTVKTVSTWLQAWKAIKRETWQVDSPSAEAQAQAEYKAAIDSKGLEPFVTVFNKNFNGLSITVHSNENGQGAVDATGAIHEAKGFIAEKMPQLFQAPASPSPAANPPKPSNMLDKNDIDAFLKNASDNASNGTGSKAQAPTKFSVFVRPAKAGSMTGLIKLEKGAKDKKTWENGILANKPYDAKAVEYQEKDLIAYPVKGEIVVKAWNDGTRYFEVPSIGANIQIKEKPATEYGGKSIPSDWQSLAQHLGLADKEFPVGTVIPTPATHIVMSVGKVSKDKNDSPVQYKNYRGLYQLES